MSLGSRSSPNHEPMDTVSKAQRSRIMAQVKSSKNLSTELAFIHILRSRSISGWRRNSSVHGRPDFVFPKSRLAVFIDGCFWHACAHHCRLPATNREYWKAKILRNAKRDRAVTQQLKRQGWWVIRFWEHDMQGGSGFTRKIRILERIVQPDKCSVRGIPRR